jgi:hypothetical protein
MLSNYVKHYANEFAFWRNEDDDIPQWQNWDNAMKELRNLYRSVLNEYNKEGLGKFVQQVKSKIKIDKMNWDER